MQSRGDRLKWARRQAGFKTAKAAAEQFGWNEPTYRAHERGIRAFKFETAVIYGRKFRVNPNWLMTGKGDVKPRVGPPTDVADLKPLEVLGEVAAGRWLEVHTAQDKISDIAVPADPRYPIEAQYALIVRGTSLNRLAQDGEVVVCVDVDKAGIQVMDDDPVVIEQTRHGLYEVTGKRVRKKGNTIELRPDSDDPKYADPKSAGYQPPLTINLDKKTQADDHEIKIKALITGAWRPFGRGRSKPT